MTRRGVLEGKVEKGLKYVFTTQFRKWHVIHLHYSWISHLWVYICMQEIWRTSSEKAIRYSFLRIQGAYCAYVVLQTKIVIKPPPPIRIWTCSMCRKKGENLPQNTNTVENGLTWVRSVWREERVMHPRKDHDDVFFLKRDNTFRLDQGHCQAVPSSEINSPQSIIFCLCTWLLHVWE